MRESIDAKESKALLRLFEINVAEEEVWVARARVGVVGDEGLGGEREFKVEGFEMGSPTHRGAGWHQRR